jgi:hypothetical protein
MMTDVAKRKHDDTTIPPINASVEDIMKALLRTPPPPAGHPTTRQAKPNKKKAEKRTDRSGRTQTTRH